MMPLRQLLIAFGLAACTMLAFGADTQEDGEEFGVAEGGEIDGDPASPRQYWTIGGMQLMSTPDFEAPPSNDAGWLAHLGVMVEDLDEAIAECHKFGVKQLPQGRNWLQLPDGLAVELIQASANSVAKVLAVNPRA